MDISHQPVMERQRIVEHRTRSKATVQQRVEERGAPFDDIEDDPQVCLDVRDGRR